MLKSIFYDAKDFIFGQNNGLMIKIFTFLFFLFFSIFASAQNYFSGQIVSDSGKGIPGVEVININTDNRVITDNDGRFIIRAAIDSDLRFVKKGYDRVDEKLNYHHFTEGFKLTLSTRTIEIDAVDVGLAMTGNLKKDVAKVTNVKADNLNQEIASFLKYGKQTELVPKATVPKEFQTASANGGLDLIKTIGLIAGLINGKPEKPIFYPTGLQTKQFYKNLKNDLGTDYFDSFGLNDFATDDFLLFCEARGHLATKYFKDYNIGSIKVELEDLFVKYQNQKKGSSIDVINHNDMAKLTASKFGFGMINVAS